MEGARQRPLIGKAPSAAAIKSSTRTSDTKRANGSSNKRSNPHAASVAYSKKGGWTQRRQLVAITAAVKWLAVLASLAAATWMVYHFQAVRLPLPAAADVPDWEFSEVRAKEIIIELAGLGAHEMGSDILDYAVYDVVQNVKQATKEVSPDVEVEIDWQYANSSHVGLDSGLFRGRTILYHSLHNVAIRISSRLKLASKANAILVSTHVDTTRFTPGAGDSTSNVAVMVELARSLAARAQNFENAVILLLNTGEEEGLMGAHAFVTQHKWAPTVRAAVDLEAIGVGGRSAIFQDVFTSGVVSSATDFQVFREVGGLPGLDFAFMESTGVYHTKFDDMNQLRNGSLQHLGENMLAFLRAVAASPELADQVVTPGEPPEVPAGGGPVYFDILGRYMVVIPGAVANLFYKTILIQCFILFLPQFATKGAAAVVSLLYALLTLALTFSAALLSALSVAFLLPKISYYPAPYIAHPWLAGLLFGCPALAGALVGHALGRKLLLGHTRKLITRTAIQLVTGRQVANLAASSTSAAHVSAVNMEAVAEDSQWETDRWLYKAAVIQFVLLGTAGTYFQMGTTYLAFAWFMLPAVAYSTMEAQYSKTPKLAPLKWTTVAIGLAGPLLLAAEPLIRLPAFMIGSLVRFDKVPGEAPLWLPNVIIAGLIALLVVPGEAPLWLPNVIIAGLIALLVCLAVAYLLPYAHRSGGTPWLFGFLLVVTAGALATVALEKLPAFSQHAPRTFFVSKVYPDLALLEGRRVDWARLARSAEPGASRMPPGVIVAASFTPGPFMRETEILRQYGFDCGSEDEIAFPSFATFTPKLGCTAQVAGPMLGGDQISDRKIAQYVARLELLSDKGENAYGAARWRDEIRWWSPPGGWDAPWPPAGSLESGVLPAAEEDLNGGSATGLQGEAEAGGAGVRAGENGPSATTANDGENAESLGEVTEESEREEEEEEQQDGEDMGVRRGQEKEEEEEEEIFEPEGVDPWEGLRESEAEYHAAVGRGQRRARVSQVGLTLGKTLTFIPPYDRFSRRWVAVIDSDKVAAFSLHAVGANGMLSALVRERPAVGLKGTHHLHLRARDDAPQKYVLTLFWRAGGGGEPGQGPAEANTAEAPAEGPQAGAAGAKEAEGAGERKPLVSVRSDMQDFRMHYIDRVVEDVSMSFPWWCARFGKQSLPFTVAYVDELLLD
eukprot:jgi/Mesen1/1054/ME000122S00049